MRAALFTVRSAMMFETNFRQVLKTELEARMGRNPKYSLRSLARDLGLSPARLSEIMGGKKGLSKTAAFEIAKRLGMNDAERVMFCDLVEAECARSQTARELALARLRVNHDQAQSRQTLTLDAFRLISDWYHFAILSLMDLPTYLDSPKWISEQLEVTPHQASEALLRLARLELIVHRDGRSYPSHQTVFTPDGVPSEAIRKAHEQLLRKAIDALYLQPVSERDFFSFIIPIASKDLSEIKERIRKFLSEINDEYSKRPGLDRVVALSNQLFNLTTNATNSPGEGK